MRHISFAWTTPAMLSGYKTCTRRDWDDGYGERFREGELVAAYNRSPRVHGVKLATIRLTEKPRLEPLALMPDSDYQAEGYEWMAAHPESLPKTLDGAPFDRSNIGWPGFRAWQSRDGAMWVIRYELVEVDWQGLQSIPPKHLALAMADCTPNAAALFIQSGDLVEAMPS